MRPTNDGKVWSSLTPCPHVNDEPKNNAYWPPRPPFETGVKGVPDWERQIPFTRKPSGAFHIMFAVTV